MSIFDEFRSRWLVATFGCILLIGGASVLFWNERRAVIMKISLDELLSKPTILDDRYQVPPGQDGRIVFLTGKLVLREPLTDPDYNIQVQAVKLKRYVQMYQWVEESVEHNYGASVATVETDSRTYYYTMEWRDKLIDSRNFQIQTGHMNPDHFPVESIMHTSDEVFIGVHQLCPQAIDKFNNFVEITSDTRPEDLSIKIHSGFYYHTYDVFNPEIGDLRILFTAAGIENQFFTVVGQLKDSKIVPYNSSRGIDILLLHPGHLTVNDVYFLEEHSERTKTWGYRFMGWVLLFFGVTANSVLFYHILTPINYLCILAPNPLNPFSANIVLASSMAFLIASIAWVLHRPMIGAILVGSAFTPVIRHYLSIWDYEPLW